MDRPPVLEVLDRADRTASLPRLGGMARADGVVIVRERYWAFAGVDGSLREGRMPAPPNALRHELRCAAASRRDARPAVLAAADRDHDAPRRHGALAGGDDGALATRAGIVASRSTCVPVPGSRAPAPDDPRATSRRNAGRTA